MKKLLFLAFPLAILTACGEETTTVNETEDSKFVESTLCNCLDSTLNVNQVECDSLFPEPLNNDEKVMRMEEAKACGIELVYTLDTVASLDSLPEPESIDEVLKMDVPDPISPECQQFLEDFASAIESYTRIVDKVEKHPEKFELMIDMNNARADLDDMASNPLMFQCDDNESFAHKVKKLNEQKDKLLE